MDRRLQGSNRDSVFEFSDRDVQCLRVQSVTAVCLPCFPNCQDLQVVEKHAFPSALAESSTTSGPSKIRFGLKPDFFRALDHYLKVVAIIGIDRQGLSNFDTAQHHGVSTCPGTN